MSTRGAPATPIPSPSPPGGLPRQVPWHPPGLPHAKAGTDAALQPCLPISFLPSCRALAGQSSFAAATLRSVSVRAPHHAVPSQIQQHGHQLRSSLPPGCPQTPTPCLSCSSSAPGLVMGPFVLLPAVQRGQESPWFQAALPPGPSKSPVSSSLPESCSPLLLGGTRLHTSPTPWGKRSWLKRRWQERGRGQSGGYLRGVPHLQREHGTG